MSATFTNSAYKLSQDIRTASQLSQFWLPLHRLYTLPLFEMILTFNSLPTKALHVLGNDDLSSQVYEHGSTAEMVKASRTCRCMYDGLQDRIRNRLARYLSTFVPSGALMNHMSHTTTSIFDQSSFAFLHCSPDIINNLDTLYLVCTPEDERATIDFILRSAFTPVSMKNCQSAKRISHLKLNTEVRSPHLYNCKGRFIALVLTSNTSIPAAAMGTLTTAFMNIIGPKLFWSAYRCGPTGRDSYQNPSYCIRPCPPKFPITIEHAHKIARDCAAQNHLLIWRTLAERPHKGQCLTHHECPQTIRSSTDEHCTFMYFGSDYRSCNAKQLRLERSRTTLPAIWRLGGDCYRDTTSMFPFLSIMSIHLDEPLHEARMPLL